jgi:hypothetical protein
MTSIEVGAAIIAVTEAIKRTFPSVEGVWTIGVAALLGLLAGLVGLGGLDWITGLIVGLTSAGAVKVATSFSGK